MLEERPKSLMPGSPSATDLETNGRGTTEETLESDLATRIRDRIELASRLFMDRNLTLPNLFKSLEPLDINSEELKAIFESLGQIIIEMKKLSEYSHSIGQK